MVMVSPNSCFPPYCIMRIDGGSASALTYPAAGGTLTGPTAVPLFPERGSGGAGAPPARAMSKHGLGGSGGALPPQQELCQNTNFLCQDIWKIIS